MRELTFILIMSPLISLAQRPVIYNLPDANLNSNTICGKSRVCDPGPMSRGIVYRFAKNPYSPDVEDSSTPETIAASVLGNAVAASLENSEELNVCSEDGVTSLITFNDVTRTGKYGLNGRSFNYNVKKKLTIDTKAAAQANIDELIRRSNSIRRPLFDSIRLELEAVYNRLKDNTLDINANYSEWALKKTTIDRVKNAPEFQACRAKLKANNWALITDIGLINYTISLNGETIRKISSDLSTKLKRAGLNVDIGSLIEKEVHKNLTAQTVQGYQIIGWRKLTI